MSDIIKKIKIKKQDGTFTDYIPIGAEAENVNVDGESVKVKLNKMPYYYNNIADLKADESLKVGDMAITLGYYEANDGGGAEYRIVDTSTGIVDDGGSYHELNNGLWAELIIKENKINVKQFGAYGDDSHNDTDILKNIFENIVQDGYIIFFPLGIYKINEDIICNKKISLKGSKQTPYTLSECCIHNIGNGGITLNGNNADVSEISFRGNGNNSTGYALKCTNSRTKIEDISIGYFNSSYGLIIGDLNAYHNVNHFHLENVFCFQCNVGCLIGSPLQNPSAPHLPDANAGVAVNLSVHNNKTGLYLKNATCNNFLSLHAEGNSDYGIYLENAFNNAFIHPYMEESTDMYFDESSINNIILGTRKSGYIAQFTGAIDNNMILTNNQTKGFSNVYTFLNTEKFKIGDRTANGTFNFDHSGHKLSLTHSQTGGIIDFTNSTSRQRLEVDYLKINTETNSNINNLHTKLGTIQAQTITANSIKKILLNDSVISNDVNFKYWMSLITFDTTLPDNLIATIETASNGYILKLCNPTSNDIALSNDINYSIFSIKHYQL